MPKTAMQKTRILTLARLFSDETDEDHGISVPEIVSRLDEVGIPAERKSVYDDIAALKDFGMDIVMTRENGRTDYRLVSRDFELAELKLLVDAVQASKFITPTKSDELIAKLSRLTSERQSRQLRRQVYVSGRVKTMNESIYYSVDTIHTAIRTNKKISFLYFNINEKKEKTYRHGGDRYVISPFELTWYDDNYYLVAYDSAAAKIKHYRVDRMERLKVTEEDREGNDLFARFDMAQYSKAMFGMYGGREELVTLRAKNYLSGAVIDRFGGGVTLRRADGDHFDVTVRVTVSVHFFAWIMGFAPDMTVIAPDTVRDEMVATLEKTLQLYGKEIR